MNSPQFILFLAIATLSSNVALVYLSPLPDSESSVPETFIINYKPTDSCLDASTQQSADYSLVSTKPDSPCPQTFANKFILESDGHISHLDQFGQKKCLECFNQNADCHLVTADCQGNSDNQQFRLRTAFHQIDDQKKRVYFSIEHALHKNKCLTGYHESHNVIFDDEPSQVTEFLSKGEKVGDKKFSAIHRGFRLEDCRKDDRQSFYLQAN